MKRKALVIIGFLLCTLGFSQSSKYATMLTLTDVNDTPTKLPYIGKKVFVLFYIDPDVQDLSDPLTEAINNKKYPKEKFGAIGVVNCKDTWIPNSAIRSRSNKKQQQYPESVILLDLDHTLKSAWKTGDGNDAMVVYVIGKDTSIQYSTIVKTKQEIDVIISKVLQTIERNLN